jgi:hypothetical protein
MHMRYARAGDSQSDAWQDYNVSVRIMMLAATEAKVESADAAIPGSGLGSGSGSDGRPVPNDVYGRVCARIASFKTDGSTPQGYCLMLVRETNDWANVLLIHVFTRSLAQPIICFPLLLPSSIHLSLPSIHSLPPGPARQLVHLCGG